MSNAKLVARVEGSEEIVVDLKCTPEGYLIVDGGESSGIQSVSVGPGLEVDTTDPSNIIISQDSLNPPVIARYRARLAATPGSFMVSTGTPSVPIPFDLELEDTDSISSDGTTFTAPAGTAGVIIKAQAVWNFNGDTVGVRQLTVLQNGALLEQSPRDIQDATATQTVNQITSPLVPTSPGDTFQIRVQQDSGTDANVIAGSRGTWVELVFYG